MKNEPHTIDWSRVRADGEQVRQEQATKRDKPHLWKPGQSGNPTGIKGRMSPELRGLFKEKSILALQKIMEVIEAPWGTHEDRDVIRCAIYVVDCVWAKPAASQPETASVAEVFLRDTLLRMRSIAGPDDLDDVEEP